MPTPDAARSRLHYLSLLSQCAGRPVRFDLVDGTCVRAAAVAALRPCVGGGALAVVRGLDTPLGVAAAASLRAEDVVCFAVPLAAGGGGGEDGPTRR
jgi:hypothetical protein